MQNLPPLSTQIAVTEQRPDPVVTLWNITPSSTDYAVAVNFESIAPTSAVGLMLASQGDSGYIFMVDPLRGVWWIERLIGEGETMLLVGPHSLARPPNAAIARLVVRVVDAVPEFMINGQAAATDTELARIQIPQSGTAGIVVRRSTAAMTGSVLAAVDSFGIYSLKALTGEDRSLVKRLPLPDAMGEFWTETGSGNRTSADIIATFPDPGDAAARFAVWGWRQNGYREYLNSETGTTLSVSIHEFRDSEAAIEAVDYLADGRRDALGLDDIDDGEG